MKNWQKESAVNKGKKLVSSSFFKKSTPTLISRRARIVKPNNRYIETGDSQTSQLTSSPRSSITDIKSTTPSQYVHFKSSQIQPEHKLTPSKPKVVIRKARKSSKQSTQTSKPSKPIPNSPCQPTAVNKVKPLRISKSLFNFEKITSKVNQASCRDDFNSPSNSDVGGSPSKRNISCSHTSNRGSDSETFSEVSLSLSESLNVVESSQQHHPDSPQPTLPPFPDFNPMSTSDCNSDASDIPLSITLSRSKLQRHQRDQRSEYHIAESSTSRNPSVVPTVIVKRGRGRPAHNPQNKKRGPVPGKRVAKRNRKRFFSRAVKATLNTKELPALPAHRIHTCDSHNERTNCFSDESLPSPLVVMTRLSPQQISDASNSPPVIPQVQPIDEGQDLPYFHRPLIVSGKRVRKSNRWFDKEDEYDNEGFFYVYIS